MQLNTDEKRWWQVSGAWLGIGTAPGALLLGALMSSRHEGAVPFFSFVLSFVFMFSIMWYQGKLGLQPPVGDGQNLTQLTPSYFGPSMQWILGIVIGIGMIGWCGFNLALGGTALGRLLNMPHWLGAFIIIAPVLLLSLAGIKSWNGLAVLATISVVILTAMISYQLAARVWPITIAFGHPADLVMDVAIMVGYVSVFSVRSPDFTVGLKRKKDLLILVLMLCLPILGLALAGIGLFMGTGQIDIIALLAEDSNLGFGNLLVFIAIIAPTFTTLYSGAPALQAAIGQSSAGIKSHHTSPLSKIVPFSLSLNQAMVIVALIGFILAWARFDLWLGNWLSILAAMLPPMVVPLAVESTLRRKYRNSILIPLWTWLPGAIIAMGFTIVKEPLAPLIGLTITAIITAIWLVIFRSGKTAKSPSVPPTKEKA